MSPTHPKRRAPAMSRRTLRADWNGCCPEASALPPSPTMTMSPSSSPSASGRISLANGLQPSSSNPQSFSRLLPCVNHLDSDADRFQEALFARDAFSGDVEGRAVIYRDSQDRKSDCDVDAGIEPMQFDGNMSLIVVHGDDQIELS